MCVRRIRYCFALLMFETLPEIQRLTSGIGQLQKQQQSLQTAYYQCVGDTDRLEKQLNKSINQIIERAKNQLYNCLILQKDVDSEKFIHSEFPVQSLIYNAAQLPEWFSFVFKKEFEKQKSTLSAVAKKLFHQHNLHERKVEMQQEITSFQNLNQRYEGLNKKERGCINIDLEAETFQNKIDMLVIKFTNYINLMGRKIIDFVEENAQRSLNYTSNIGNFAQNPGWNGLAQNYYERQSRREGKSIEKDNFRNAMPTAAMDRGYRVGEVEPRRQLTRAVSSNRCLNHANHDHFHNARPVIMAHDYGCSRFNYRDHAPKWMMANSLSSFYY